MSEMFDKKTAVLANVLRGGLVENQHCGWAVVTDADGKILYQTPGADSAETFFRSSAKPFQALPLVEDDLHQQLSLEELALVCASHSGTDTHVQLAQSILKKAAVDMSCLVCGPHFPLDESSKYRMIQQNTSPNALHNNCSGKHGGMLLYCQHHQLTLNTYAEARHPLQQRIAEILKTWTGAKAVYPTAIDGCGAPTFYMPMAAMAHLYARLGVEPVTKPLVEAMTTHPYLVGGENRVDTLLMALSEGKLLAKLGAEGIIGVSRVGQGQGLFLKVADGNMGLRDRLVLALLNQLGWVDEALLSHPKMLLFSNNTHSNTQGVAVGTYAWCLPQ